MWYRLCPPYLFRILCLAPHLAPLVKNFGAGAVCQRGGGQGSCKVPSPDNCSLALAEEDIQVGVALGSGSW